MPSYLQLTYLSRPDAVLAFRRRIKISAKDQTDNEMSLDPNKACFTILDGYRTRKAGPKDKNRRGANDIVARDNGLSDLAIVFMAPYEGTPLAGGVSRFVLELSHVLMRRDISCRTIWRSPGRFPGLRLIHETLAAILALKQRTILHVQNGFPVSVGAAALAKVLGYPVVVTHHGRLPSGNTLRRASYRATELSERLFATRVTAVDTVSKEYYAADLMIQNGVDVSRFSPDPMGGKSDLPVRFLYLGRKARNKGLELLLKATRLAHPRERFEVTVAGPDSEQMDAGLVAEAENAGIGDRFHVLPAVDDPIKEYRKSSVFVFPTAYRAEGLSLALLEAMACGLPPLLPYLPQYGELIRPGWNSRIFKENDVTQLAREMTFMADNPVVNQSLGQHARETIVKGFSIETVADQYVSLYNSIVKK